MCIISGINLSVSKGCCNLCEVNVFGYVFLDTKKDCRVPLIQARDRIILSHLNEKVPWFEIYMTNKGMSIVVGFRRMQ